jgi:hypothetical protein
LSLLVDPALLSLKGREVIKIPGLLDCSFSLFLLSFSLFSLCQPLFSRFFALIDIDKARMIVLIFCTSLERHSEQMGGGRGVDEVWFVGEVA